MVLDLVKLTTQVKPEEGCRLHAYRDINNVWTIGWGHTTGVCEGLTCTQAQADAWFDEDLQGAVAELYRALPWVQMHDDVRQRVLADMTFNEGLGSAASGDGLLSFVHMLAAFQSKDYDAAANQLLDSKAAKHDAPERYQRLATMLRTGQDAPIAA